MRAAALTAALVAARGDSQCRSAITCPYSPPPEERRRAVLAHEPAASMNSTTTGAHRACIISDRRALVRRLPTFRSLARSPVMGGRGMTGRESAESLCRRVIAILDANLPDADTVRQLREMFDIPDPDPRAVSRGPGGWPILKAAD